MESSGANSVKPVSFICLTWQQVWQRRVNNRCHILDISSYFDYFAHFPKQTREIQLGRCILTVLLYTEDTKIQPAIDMMIPAVQWTSGSISSVKVAKGGSPVKKRRRRKKIEQCFLRILSWIQTAFGSGSVWAQVDCFTLFPYKLFSCFFEPAYFSGIQNILWQEIKTS